MGRHTPPVSPGRKVTLGAPALILCFVGGYLLVPEPAAQPRVQARPTVELSREAPSPPSVITPRDTYSRTPARKDASWTAEPVSRSTPGPVPSPGGSVSASSPTQLALPTTHTTVTTQRSGSGSRPPFRTPRAVPRPVTTTGVTSGGSPSVTIKPGASSTPTTRVSLTSPTRTSVTTRPPRAVTTTVTVTAEPTKERKKKKKERRKRKRCKDHSTWQCAK